MRRFFVGLVGFAVIAFAASLCYADEGETESLQYSLDLNKLFGTTFQEEEKAKVTCGGWGQTVFVYDGGDYDPVAQRTVGGDETLNVWRFRILPKVEYKWLTFGAQYDTFGGSLNCWDFWANINCPKYKDKVQLKVGQFIPPFGLQRPCSPYKLWTVNYSQIVGSLFGGAALRDSGWMVHGKMKYGQEVDKFQPNVFYAVGCFNGENAYVSNSDPFWTFFTTVQVEQIKGILFGISYEDGSRFNGTRQVNRDRFGLCIKIELDALMIQAEWMAGNANVADEGKHDIAPTAHNKRQLTEGGYLEFGYYIMPKKVQLMTKVDFIDIPAWTAGADSRTPSNVSYTQTWVYGFGFNWYINKHCKVQVFYQWQRADGRHLLKGIARSEQSGVILFGVNF